MTDYTYTGAVVFDTITTSGMYDISADGAQGGGANSSGQVGGFGAHVSGDIYLSQGAKLEIVVGGEGGSGSFAGGGGGGSFVFETGSSLDPVLIAGGGGGAGANKAGGVGETGESGSAGTGVNPGAGGSDGNPGHGSLAYPNNVAYAGGAGGGYSGGTGGSYTTGPAKSGSNGTAFKGGAPGSGGDTGGFGGGGGGGSLGGGGGGGWGGGGGGGGADDPTTGGGGGGGGSFDTDLTNLAATAGANSGNGEVSITFESSICYLHGTQILTPAGLVAVEDLLIGDAVVTRFGAIQRIKWLGRQSYAPEFLANHKEKWPVRIQAGALEDGVPARDLYVSPGHSMLLGDVLVLASTLVNGITITQARPETQVSYVQIELAAHDCVIAEGAWSETYADAPGMRAQFHNAAQFYALYPDEPPVEELRLCAKRPERGEALESALLPVVARAAVTPGPLEGWVEAAGEWEIEGWARDLAHAELPVQLEILAGERLLGIALAREFREDLRQAGKGTGHGGFSFIPPFRLQAEHVAALVIRRAADGAQLPRAERFRKAA